MNDEIHRLELDLATHKTEIKTILPALEKTLKEVMETQKLMALSDQQRGVRDAAKEVQFNNLLGMVQTMINDEKSLATALLNSILTNLPSLLFVLGVGAWYLVKHNYI